MHRRNTNDSAHVQVAHFLEADLRPWAAALAAALFGPQPAEDDADSRWNFLDALAPLHGAVDAVLRAWRLPLREQLPLTPAEWQPAVISSHAVGGKLTLCFPDFVRCSGAMHAVRDVSALALDMGPLAKLPDPSGFQAAVLRIETSLASLPALRTFRFRASHYLCDHGYVFPLVPVLARMAQLAHLELRDNSIDAAALAPPLACLTALTALHLDGNELGKRGAAAIAPALSRLSRLASLTLAGNSLDAAAVAALPLGNLTALTALDLSDNALLLAGAQALAPALDRLRKLAVLNLEDNGVGGVGLMFTNSAAGAASLAPPLGRLAALTALDLGMNYFRDDAVESLAPALSRLSRLAHLVLRRNEIGAAGAAALAPPLGVLTALTLLDLRANDIGATGAEALAPALSRLSMLAHLELSGNAVGTRGAAALAPTLATLTALTRLDISGNRIEDAGALRLVPALARLTALRRLALTSYQGISAAGEAALREALPPSVWDAQD